MQQEKKQHLYDSLKISSFSSLTASAIRPYFPVEPWPHQVSGTLGTLALLDRVQAATCTSPTGSGKSVIMSAITSIFALHGGLRVQVYTNRKLLTQQTANNLKKHGISHGIRAASLPHLERPDENVQITSIQTEISRLSSPEWDWFDADLVIVDEAHMYTTGKARQVIERHMKRGAHVILVTATPVNLFDIAPEVHVAATLRELRKIGALVPAICKAPREMDVRKVRRIKERFSLKSIRERAWSQAIVGHIVEDWRRFNPDGRMTLGFAPGVPESRAMAIAFSAAGIPAAHIDASEVWLNGEYIKDTNQGERRNEIIQMWKDGKIKVLWNCQVFREAVDIPELYHLILATPICSLKDYLQVVGRVLRRSEQTPDHVLITDHAANLYRHGSPNEDRDWLQMYYMTDTSIRESQEEKRRKALASDDPNLVAELAVMCPKCGTMVKAGRSCPPPPLGCGEPVLDNNPRMLRYITQEDGKLITWNERQSVKRELSRQAEVSSDDKVWRKIFFASRNSKSPRAMNFRQAAARYRKETGRNLPAWMPFTPIHDEDWSKKIRDVPFSRLKRPINPKSPMFQQYKSGTVST